MMSFTHRWSMTVALAVSTAVILTGCVSTGSTATGSSGEDASGPLVIQSAYTDAQKQAVTDLVTGFTADSGTETTVNTLDAETFRAQLPTYLTSSNPPDLYTYFAGAATQSYATQDLLLDMSDVWSENLTGYPDALKKLSTTDGKQYFIPTDYYWWGIYYRKSVFEKYGVEVPTTWDEFLAACQTIQDAGGTPIGIGLSDTPWLAAAWFDYLNLRINGAQYHLDLLAGEHKFTDDRVVDVMNAFSEILPYFDSAALGETMASSQTKLAQGETAMYLTGSFVQTALPAEIADDIAFFQFPTIDESVPRAEEAPTDGFVASANSTRPDAVKAFAAYAASAKGQKELVAGLGTTTLPANPSVEIALDALATQGKEQLESADQLTQFFNRDASDELLTPATAALTKFMANPDDLTAILAEWENASAKARE